MELELYEHLQALHTKLNALLDEHNLEFNVDEGKYVKVKK